MSSEKSLMFIDAQNVLRSWTAYCRENDLEELVDYVKLRDVLSQGTDLIRPYFYDGVPNPVPERKKIFLKKLENEGFRVCTKQLKNRGFTCRSCGTTTRKNIQKGVDVWLATDILRHAHQGICRVIIVVSGDGDYYKALDLASNKGLRIWVASFKRSLSTELSRVADKVIYLEDIFDEITLDLRTS